MEKDCIGPLQKASGPREKEKTAMYHSWDTHHIWQGAIELRHIEPDIDSRGVVCNPKSR